MIVYMQLISMTSLFYFFTFSFVFRLNPVNALISLFTDVSQLTVPVIWIPL